MPHESRADNRLLVVVPCGTAKVWDRRPGIGHVPAREAYTGVPFRAHREYAERFGDAWVVLSAKYGFLRPDDTIPGPYNVTFKRRSSDPMAIATLRGQVRAMELDAYADVIVLGGKEYRAAAEAAFAGTDVRLHFPFAGLPLGRALSAVNRAITDGGPGLASER